MPKQKVVPLIIEQEYIRRQKQIDKLLAQQEVVKRKLLTLHKKGWLFTLIRPSDTSAGVVSIPWKLVALELIAKIHPSKLAQEDFIRKLYKRFPKTFRTPTLNFDGKKVNVDA